MAAVRQDVMLAAYAVSLGFQIESGRFDDKGIPVGTLAFNKGKIRVWCTERGWRVARQEGDRFLENPSDRDYFAKLKKALDAGHAQAD